MFTHSPRRCASISLLALAGYMLFSSEIFAQERVATVEEMRERSSPGDRVVLVKTNGDSVSGKLVRISDDDIEIRTEVDITKQRSQIDYVIVPHTAVRSLDLKASSTSKGTYIGAGVGAGVTLSLFAVAYTKDRNEVDEWGPGYLLLGAITTGAGAFIGHFFNASKPHLRYERPDEARLKFRASPLYERNMRGVRLSIAF